MSHTLLRGLVSIAIVLSGAATVAAQPLRLQATECSTPPPMHCPEANCPRDIMANRGSAVDAKTGRTYFLDYPCDLKKGDKVTFVLSLHGAGSNGQWQRHYFPIMDYKDKYKLVIATPTAATAQPTRTWQSGPDDGHLQNIVTAITEQLGKENVKAFWLAGHSQGGATSTRLVCTDFFKGRVDGFLSLSGGRIGGSPGRSGNFANLAPRGDGAGAARGAAPGAARGDAARGPAVPAGAAAGRGTQPSPATTCDYSHIYAIGEHEIGPLPKTSTWAEKYQCDAAPKKSEIVDTKAGYVHDGSRQDPGSKGWGLLPRPGKAEVYVYKGCKDSRVVADVVRIDKGHTEGLEPKVSEELVKLLTSARGGKIQRM